MATVAGCWTCPLVYLTDCSEHNSSEHNDKISCILGYQDNGHKKLHNECVLNSLVLKTVFIKNNI